MGKIEVVVFEDQLVRRLYPVTVGRPAYAVLCGGYRLIDWLTMLGGSVRGLVRPHLSGLQQADFPQLAEPVSEGGKSLLYVNARLVPAVSTFRALRKMVNDGRPGAVRTGEALAAALLPAASSCPAPTDAAKVDASLSEPAFGALPTFEADLPLLEYPHEIVRYNLQCLRENLEYRLAQGEYRELADGVFAAPGAELGPYSVSNTRDGPIVLGANTQVGPFCCLSGPADLGEGTRVIEHAVIKDAVSIGHTAKIGGEVEASIIEPYTNKQHHGFLGHSYVGSWVNLGAGTCNSDLKNTYGMVKMEHGGEKIDTGMQFVGCIMGDYAKSAINTSIFTGKTIGVCSMLYGFVTTNVASFVNYARWFGQVTELPPNVMIATQERMFARRGKPQRPCDQQLIRDMYELTRHERQLGGEPLSL